MCSMTVGCFSTWLLHFGVILHNFYTHIDELVWPSTPPADHHRWLNSGNLEQFLKVSFVKKVFNQNTFDFMEYEEWFTLWRDTFIWKGFVDSCFQVLYHQQTVLIKSSFFRETPCFRAHIGRRAWDYKKVIREGKIEKKLSISQI